jgi:hypothetical protein
LKKKKGPPKGQPLTATVDSSPILSMSYFFVVKELAIAFCRGRSHPYFWSMAFAFLVVSKIAHRASQAALLA